MVPFKVESKFKFIEFKCHFFLFSQLLFFKFLNMIYVKFAYYCTSQNKAISNFYVPRIPIKK